MLYLKSCTKWRGDMYEDKDSYGAFHQCLQCGLIRDLGRAVDAAHQAAPSRS